MISELVSKRMSGRPMYIALAAQTLAMIFGNTENAESNTGNMGLMTNVSAIFPVDVLLLRNLFCLQIC